MDITADITITNSFTEQAIAFTIKAWEADYRWWVPQTLFQALTSNSQWPHYDPHRSALIH